MKKMKKKLTIGSFKRMAKLEKKREIKFRAWDTEEKVMYENDRFMGDYDDLYFGDINDIFAKEPEVIFMQFTGLKDKKGKEIYEGDILANREVHGDNFYCVVEYGIDGFNGVTYPGRNHCMPLHTIMTYEGAEYNEVIGNIYENPELIKEK